MPAGWKNAVNARAILKEMADPETGNTRWQTVVKDHRLHRVESLAKIDATSGAVQLEIETPNPVNPLRVVQMDAAALASPKDFKVALHDRNVFISDTLPLQELVMDWLRKVQGAGREKNVVGSMGWVHKDGNIIGFATGDTVYHPDGRAEEGAVVLDGGSGLGAQYIPMGDIQKWKAVADFIAQQGQMPLVTILASAFASPLVRLTGLSGALLSVVSTKSGVGKTSAIQTAQAVWGSRGAMHGTDDTALSFTSKMGSTNNLPVYWDDIKGEAAFKKLPDLVYQITQGREKSRLDASAKLRDIKTWDTLATFAANDSIIELMRIHDNGNGSDATIARIFEIRLEDRPTDDRVSPAFFDCVRTNYGHAGAIYAAALAKNHEKIKAALLAKHAALEKELAVPSEERFWVMIVACLVVGASLAKGLGLVDFAPDKLETYLKRHLQSMRGIKNTVMESVSAKELLADMIADLAPDSVLLEALPARGPGGEAVVLSHPRLHGGIKAVRSVKDSVYRVRASVFAEWMTAKKQNADSVLRQLEELEAVERSKPLDLGAGTQYRQHNRARCHEIDLKKVGL